MEKYKVLIIEDEGDTASSVQGALELYDIKSDIAVDGEEGIKLFTENDYDLILLDLKMPKKCGDEVLKLIRSKDPFIDVIVYTNYQDFADIRELTNIGIDGYINKGVGSELKELISKIREKLEPLDESGLVSLLKGTIKNISE